MRKSSYLCTRKKAKASTSLLCRHSFFASCERVCHPQISNGAIAQLVEHRTENPCVTGSNPVGTTQRKQLQNIP